MDVYGSHGPLARLTLLFVAATVWLLTGFGRWRRGRVVILCYHGVTASQAPRFRRQIASIAGRTVALDELADDTPRRGLPRVCVTFDDGFANLLEHALPVTRELGVPVTLFPVTGSLGATPAWLADVGHHPDSTEETMTPDQLAAAASDRLCTVGSHTVTHPNLTHLDPAQRDEELVRSREALETLLERPVTDLAFPFGIADDAVLDASFAAGYTRVFTLEPPAGMREGDPRVFRRMVMSPDVWPIEFRLTAAGAYAWLAPLKRWLRRRNSD